MSYRHPLAQLLWGTVTTHTAPAWHRAPGGGGSSLHLPGYSASQPLFLLKPPIRRLRQGWPLTLEKMGLNLGKPGHASLGSKWVLNKDALFSSPTLLSARNLHRCQCPPHRTP